MTQSDPPFISVLIPAYNRPDYLCTAVRSILSNTFTNFEIVISEDRSPGQEKVLERLRDFSSDPRIRWYAQSENLGWSMNRNFLVSQARGQYVWLMGDDDMLPHHALAHLHAFISRHPGRDIYACGYEVIDEFDRHRYSRHAAREVFLSREDPVAFQQLLLSQALPFWLFHPFTFAYKRELGIRHPYVSAAHIGDDLFFLYECFRTGKSIAVSPEILFQWRKFSPAAGQSATAQVNLSSAINGIKARAHILDLFQASREWRDIIADLFPKGDFTERFLYSALQADSGHREPLWNAIIKDPELALRFEAYDPRFAGIGKLRIRLQMLRAYLHFNGLKGASQLFVRACHEGFAHFKTVSPVIKNAS